MRGNCFPLWVLFTMAFSTGLLAEDALRPVALENVKLSGSIGRLMDRCIHARAYSEWAKGPMYDECENAFRTHWDDKWPGWQNEYWGKTMLCFCGAIAYTGDCDLAAWAVARAKSFVKAYQRPNGYLSTYSDEDFIRFDPYNPKSGVFNIWGQKYTFWALIELYRVSGNIEFLEAGKKMADHLINQLKRLDIGIEKTGHWYGVSSMSILRPMNELYRITGDSRYLDFSTTIVDAMSRKESRQGAIVYNAFRKEPICTWFENPTHWAKAYEILSCLEGLVDYFRLTGNRKCLDAAKKWYEHLLDEELNPMRSVGYFDHFVNAKMHLNGMTELCDVVHWIRFLREMFIVTGETQYADRLEEAFYNAFLAGVWRDGRWGAHVIRSHGTRHVSAPPQTGMIEHQCCPDNMMRTFFDVAMTSGFVAGGGDERIVLYHDAEFAVGKSRYRVHGGYPYSDAFWITRSGSKDGRIKFRVPYWTNTVLIDGETAKAVDGWCELPVCRDSQTWCIAFDMRPRILESACWRREEMLPFGSDDLEIRQYTVRNMEWMTPEMQGLIRKDPAEQVMRGPLVLAKGRLAGTSRSETLGATTYRGRGFDVKLSGCGFAVGNAAVQQSWSLIFERGEESKSMPVADFASLSNVDDPENWFSVWF